MNSCAFQQSAVLGCQAPLHRIVVGNLITWVLSLTVVCGVTPLLLTRACSVLLGAGSSIQVWLQLCGCLAEAEAVFLCSLFNLFGEEMEHPNTRYLVVGPSCFKEMRTAHEFGSHSFGSPFPESSLVSEHPKKFFLDIKLQLFVCSSRKSPMRSPVEWERKGIWVDSSHGKYSHLPKGME